jgi:hypothetical protein
MLLRPCRGCRPGGSLINVAAPVMIRDKGADILHTILHYTTLHSPARLTTGPLVAAPPHRLQPSHLDSANLCRFPALLMSFQALISGPPRLLAPPSLSATPTRDPSPLGPANGDNGNSRYLA